jgi:hypothetical protein
MCGRVVLAPIRERFGGARNAFPANASRYQTSEILRFRVLRNSSSCRYGHDEKDQTDDQEQEEQEFGDSRSRNGNTGEAKKRRNERDYQKD